MGLRIRSALATLICVATGCVMLVRVSAAETLADAIRARGLTANPEVLRNFDKPITSSAVFQNAQEFLIAYYVDDGSGLLKEPLFVDRYDEVGRVWAGTEIAGGDPKVAHSWCLGSAVSIRASTQGDYLGTHLNPSARCTIVLSRDLAVQAVLTGWVRPCSATGRSCTSEARSTSPPPTMPKSRCTIEHAAEISKSIP